MKRGAFCLIDYSYLLTNHKVYLAENFGIELNVESVGAECLDSAVCHDLSLIDLDALLLESLCDISSCDAAVKSAVCTCCCLDLDSYALKLICNCSCCSLLLLDLEILCILFILCIRKGLCICLDSKLSGEEEVSCVSVGYVYDLILLALSLYVLSKHYLHCFLSPLS